MSLNLDAKSAAIGAGVVFAATQFFGGSSKKSTGTNGLGRPASKRKSSGTKKAKSSTTKRKTTKRK